MRATDKGRAAAWFVAATMGAVNAAGCAFDPYARFWRFDRILHTATILAATFWLALFVCHRVLRGGRGDGALLVAAIASVGLAVGALWEVAELGFERIAPGDAIKGKHDTIVDIVVDPAGALLAGVAGAGSLRPGRARPMAAAPPAARRAP